MTQRQLLGLALRDLRDGARGLWVLCASLALGVTLIAASAGLHQQVNGALEADARALLGGDVKVQSRTPLPEPVLTWMRARGQVSLLLELRTMLRTEGGVVQLVELQVTDSAYPLYGEVSLAPDGPLQEALAKRGGEWGAAFDPTLERRLGLTTGDRAWVGDVALRLRARVERQPDRSLRANWRGAPLLIATGALADSGLVQPGSLLEYEYRVRIDDDAGQWRQALAEAFPDTEFDVRTFESRSQRVAEVMGQVGSALLLVGFSALFIGGLGVFNSIHAYLQGKLATIATLRALGLRDARLAAVFLVQVLLMAVAASTAGALAGGGLAIAGTAVAAERLPVQLDVQALAIPLVVSLGFGLLTALTFALPAIGRALSVSPAALFRGIDANATATPRRWWIATAACAALTAGLIVAAVPQPMFGLVFVVVVSAVLALLEGLVRLLRRLALRLADDARLEGRFALRLAVASLHRPGSPLRASLLSLGAAVTLLVTCALVVGTLLRVIGETVPENNPTLVFYDIPSAQADDFRSLVGESASLQRLHLAPLVLGRLEAVNGVPLADSADPDRALEARDEHKMSYRQGNFDHLAVELGAWWPEGYAGPPRVAMEDREADQIGLQVGDWLRFRIFGEPVEAQLVAIYGQRRFQSRFWLEAVFSPGVLDPFITRYVGAAYMDDDDGFDAQTRIATTMPHVVTIHTSSILDEATMLLGRASAGLAVVAGVTLLASLLVLASVMAGSRVRQVHDATVLHLLGARIQVIRNGLWLEYTLLAILVAAFALTLGGAIASAFLALRLELEGGIAWSAGIIVALGVSALSLGAGARWLLAQLRLSPALLLRAG